METKNIKLVLVLVFSLCLIFFVANIFMGPQSVIGYGYGYSGKITTVRSTNPAISPDGNYLVYTNCEDGCKLYKKGITDSGNGSAITTAWALDATYSPDGNYIVYSNDSDNGKLYRKSANDTTNGSAINSASDSYEPSYSPDGNYIVYSNGSDLGKLYRKNASDANNGSAITTVYGQYPVYSPDGNYIAYTGSNHRLYRKTAGDVSDGELIATDQIHDGKISYSPDGNYIAYSNLSQKDKLFRKDANNESNGERLTEGGVDDVIYAPGGHDLYYLRSSRIYRKDLRVKDITTFYLDGNFAGAEGSVTGTINPINSTIAVTVPYGTDVTALKPRVGHLGASVSPTNGAAHNFTSPVTTTVTAFDGSTKNYTVTVSRDSDKSAKAITRFRFEGINTDVDINSTTHIISVTVPHGTDLTSLTPTITYSGASVSPASGAANNFSNDVTYTVTAENNETQSYTVKVEEASKSNLAGTKAEQDKYHYYKKRYKNTGSTKTYNEVRGIKLSSWGEFQKMKQIFIAHKYDKKADFAKLDKKTQETFKKYKKYNGYRNYKIYRNKVK